jgi:hypothetical protein
MPSQTHGAAKIGEKLSKIKSTDSRQVIAQTQFSDWILVVVQSVLPDSPAGIIRETPPRGRRFRGVR